jgi:cytochrome c oxidase assembly protein subunit 15
MRHNYAGLAIPTFPLSTPGGALLPAVWDYRVVLQFTHRVMALVVALALAVYAHMLWRDPALSAPLRWSGVGLLGLVALQILLGAEIIWTARDVYVTTGHVLVGALTLAATFLVTFFVNRGALDSPGPGAATAALPRAEPAPTVGAHQP